MCMVPRKQKSEEEKDLRRRFLTVGLAMVMLPGITACGGKEETVQYY